MNSSIMDHRNWLCICTTFVANIFSSCNVCVLGAWKSKNWQKAVLLIYEWREWILILSTGFQLHSPASPPSLDISKVCNSANCSVFHLLCPSAWQLWYSCGQHAIKHYVQLCSWPQSGILTSTKFKCVDNCLYVRVWANGRLLTSYQLWQFTSNPGSWKHSPSTLTTV